MRIRCTKAVICLGILAILVAMSPAAYSGIITDTKDLPPDGVYLSTDIHEIYEGADLKFLLSLPEHKPYVGGPQGSDDVTREKVGDDEIETFNSGLSALLQIVDDGGNEVMPATPILLEGMVQTTVFGFHDPNVYDTEPGVGTFATEIVALSLSMGNPFGAATDISVEILPSSGEVTVQPFGAQWQIDSFFDVFTELTIDTNGFFGFANGVEVLSGTLVGGAHMELMPDPTIPEPGTITLLAFAGLALLGYRWRRKRAA